MVCEATVTLCNSWGVRALEVPAPEHFTGSKLSSLSAGSCMLGAGQCDAQRPVICTAGLHVQFWGGGIAVEVKAEQGAWVVSNGRFDGLRWVGSSGSLVACLRFRVSYMAHG